MGNLNCSNSTLDNNIEIRSPDINPNNTLGSKHNNLKISSLIRTMIKSKSCPPKDKLSLKEKNYIFSDKMKNIETKNNTKNFRRSFTPRRSKQFKISEDNKNKYDSESFQQKKIIKNKLKKDAQNKETEKEEENDKNKKGTILKKGKSSPLEVICEQIEDEKKVLDTTRTIKNKEIIQPSNSKNIKNDNNSEQNNNVSNINNNKNENIKNNKTQNLTILNLINNSNYFSNSSNININKNNNKENSELKKNELHLYFNHTGSSRGEEEHISENIYCNNYNYYNNLHDNMENKEFNKNLYVKEQYKDLYKKKIYTNKYHKELNWRNINIDQILSNKSENDILLKGEFLVFNNILEINSSNKLKYSRYLTLTKHVINIFRSKEKYIYNENPLINISLFNISKCDLLNKSDIEMLKNLKNLLLKYSLFIKLTTVNGMVIVEPSKNSKKYRISNPFLKANYNKPKSLNRFTKRPKDIELITQKITKSQNKNNLIKIKNGEINDNNSKKNQNKYGLYIIISSDDDILLLNLIAIINFLRK